MSYAETQKMRARARAERDARSGPRLQSSSATPVTLVTGPPCSGKSTYVRDHMRPGDLVVDYDAIAQAIGSPDGHDHPRALHPFALHVKDALLDRLTRSNDVRRVWLVKVVPTPGEVAIASEVVTLDVPADECKRRAAESGRPERWADLIDDWWRSRATLETTD